MTLAIRTTYARSTIQIHHPTSRIQQQVTQARIDYDGPSMEIDLRSPMTEMGLGDYKHLMRTAANEGNQAALAGIARRSYEGDRFAGEMSNQDVVQRLSKEQTQSDVPEVNVGMIPKSRPSISFQYQVNIHWEQGDVAVEFNTQPPRIQWDIGSVDISVKGSNLDIRG